MSSTFTVDASVFLNAFNPYEEGYQDSQCLLARMQAQALPIVVPTLLLPEVAAAIGRGRDDTALARAFAHALTQLPHLVWVPLDGLLVRQVADVAAQYRLRGSDAVYAAVALRFGSTLITLTVSSETACPAWSPPTIRARHWPIWPDKQTGQGLSNLTAYALVGAAQPCPRGVALIIPPVTTASARSSSTAGTMCV
jgi:predicted nucleic acid-binding protein